MMHGPVNIKFAVDKFCNGKPCVCCVFGNEYVDTSGLIFFQVLNRVSYDS